MKASNLPKDQQWITEMCELVKAKLPEGYTFIVFGFPCTSESDRCYYASNATRESSIEALETWIDHAKKQGLGHTE